MNEPVQSCPKCDQHLPLEAFSPSKRGKKGSMCRACQKVYSREYSQRNREKLREQHREYQRRTPEKQREYRQRWQAKRPDYQREWRRDNPDKRRQYSQKWRRNNPDKVQAQKEAYKRKRPTYHAEHYANNKERYRKNGQRYYIAHKAKKNAQAREWYQQNRGKVRAIWMRRRALKRAATVAPIDFDAILRRDGWVCHLCGGLIAPGDLHFDHIVPLSKGGAHSEENLSPSHSWCNKSKQARTDVPSAAPPRIKRRRRKAP